MNMIAEIPEPGLYFSITKLVFLLILTIPWLYFAPWVHKDARRVRTSQGLWGLAILASGALGVVIWMLMPVYAVGLLVYLVMTGAAYTAYIVHRNGRVTPEARVFTSDYFQALLSHKQQVKVEITHRVKVYGADGRVVQPPAEDDPPEVRQAYNAAQGLLYDMLFYRASEADIAPVGSEARVRFVVDGVLAEREPLAITASEAILQYIKPIGGMNADERRRPQQGKISVDMAGKAIDMLLTTAGTTGGQRIQFKIVQEFVQTHLDQLGISPELLPVVKKMALSPGLVIVSGKSQSGVTSTLYSLLRIQDAFTKQLVTLETKPVVDLENVTQTAYGDPSALLSNLASILRRDPDLVMLDRCDDPKAAALLLEFAARKTVLLGVQGGDTFIALAKWAKTCGAMGAAVEPLNGVLCQILLRKLCPSCREAYKPDPQFLAKANLPAQKIDRFYRPPSGPLVDAKGQPYICPTCQGAGYLGRTAAFEVLAMNDELRALVASDANLSKLQAACRKGKMLYLQEQALRKVIEGVTSVQEVIRVTQQAKKG